jgi:hypothetical protein
VDQLYFESGYLVDGYYTIIREAEAALPVAVTLSALVDIADATGYYIPDYIVTDYFVSGQILEANAALNVFVTQAVSVERIREAAVTASVSATNTCTVTRFTQSDVTLNVAAANTCTVTRIIDGSVSITAAFAPTLIANALKNHTAVMDSVSTMSVDAVANRSANVLLDYIADLNAMAAKTVDVISTASTTATQSTTANTNSSAQATVTSTVTLTCEALNLQFASADFTVSAKILAVTSRNQYSRPITIDSVVPEFFTNNVKYGTHAVGRGGADTLFKTTANSNIRFVNQNVLEGWIYSLAAIGDGATVLAIGASGGSTTNVTGDNQWILHYKEVTNGQFAMRLLVKNSSGTTQVFQTTPTGDAATLNQYRPAVGAYTHYAVTRDGSGVMRVFRNGSEIISGTVTTMGTASEYRAWFGHNGTYNRWDELSLRKKTSTITQAQQTDQPETQVFLFHLDNNFNDDTSNTINVTHSMAATLASTVTVSAQANANTKLASADLSASSTVSATGIRTQVASADLVTVSTLTVIIGSVKDSIALNAGAFTVTAQESRLRDAASSITSAFAPTLTAQATRRVDITMSTVFAMSTTATSFTDCNADIATAFSVTCSPSVDFKAIGSLQSQANINVLGGKLKLFQADFTSALAFTVQAIGFEGTGVGLNTVSSLSVSARRLRTVVSAASSTFTQTTIGNNNPAPFEISDYELFSTDFSASFEWQFPSNVPGSYDDLITDPFLPPAVLTTFGTGLSVSYFNGQGDDYVFIPVAYLKRVGTDQYQLYVRERQYSISASVTNGLSTNTWRSFGIDVSAINQTTGAFTITASFPMASFANTYSEGVHGTYNIKIVGNPNYVFAPVSIENFISNSSVRNASYERLGQIYSIPYPLGTSADFRNVTSLSAEATEVVIPDPAVFSTQAQIAAIGNGSFRGSATLASTFTTFINADKNVEIASNVASLSTITVSAVKVTRAGADISVVTAQSTVNVRTRTTAVTLTSAVSASIEAVKRTGIVLNLDTTATQTVTGFRIQQGESSISALYSQLSVAVQNASGTVLLETVTQMQTIAEKNAVGVIQLASAFTQSTDTADAKTVRVSSAMAAEFTQVSEGLRIQPAGADLTAQFTQTANTDLSKTTRVSADVNTTVSMTTVGLRLRDGIALQASLGTLSCDIDRLRQFDSNLSAVIYDFTASPTFIIRITADFTAFNSQLTVGEIINIDPFLQLKIEPETRINKIPQESRVLSIESETRVNIIKD